MNLTHGLESHPSAFFMVCGGVSLMGLTIFAAFRNKSNQNQVVKDKFCPAYMRKKRKSGIWVLLPARFCDFLKRIVASDYVFFYYCYLCRVGGGGEGTPS